MLQFTKTETGFLVSCTDNEFYLIDGVISMPFNSLSLTLDASQIATFKKSTTGDVFISGKIGNITFDGETPTKSEMAEAFADTCLAETGGGGDLEERVADLEADVVELEAEIEENEQVTAEALTSLRQTILGNEQVTAEALTELRALIAEINTTIGDSNSGLVKRIGDLESANTALGSRMTQAEQDITTLDTVMSAAVNQLS